MSVTWSPSTTAPYGSRWTPPVQAPHTDAVLQAVSVLLGVGTGRLQAELASGQSLQAIASTQHVSTNQLVSTLAEAIQASSSALTSTEAHLIAAEIAQRSGALQVIGPQPPAIDGDGGSTAAPVGAVAAGAGASAGTAGGRLDLRM